MPHPTVRVLAVLELLQAHGTLSGPQIAHRLGVDPRTVRRYVALLEELGIPVTAQRGRHGGYSLVAGFKLPPMVFNDDEAFALSLGVLAARQLGLARSAPGLVSLQAKLERVMPPGLRRRLHAASETTTLDLPSSATPADAGALAVLTEATQAQRAVRLAYRAADGSDSERRLDPYGLVYRGGRWYVSGYCHLRRDVRSFRVDRILSLRALPEGFERPRDFDALDSLKASLAALPRTHSAQILLRTDLATARRHVFVMLGRLEALAPPDEGVLLHAEADDLDWLARELARLPFAFVIRRPAALRRRLAKLATHLACQAGAG